MYNLDAVLRQNTDKPLSVFSDVLLNCLAEQFEAAKGVVYVKRETGVFEAISFYGCTPQNLPKTSFVPGDGVSGQAAKSGRFFYYEKLPVTDTLSVRTSFGEIGVYSMLALPLVFNQETLAVVELLFFNDLFAEWIPVLDKVSVNAGAVFSSVILLNNTQNLLKLSEIQSKQLQAQEEELRQNLVLLERANEDAKREMLNTHRLRMELQARIDVLNKSALVTESDLFGTITYANEKFAEVSKFSVSECLGKPHSIIRHPDTPKEIFREMWQTIKSGKIYKNRYKNRAKDGSEYWVDAVIAPVFNEKSEIVKFIGIRFDITAMVKQQERIENLLNESEYQKASLIAQQEEELRQNLEEILAIQSELERQVVETDNIKNELIARVDVLNSTALVTESDLFGTITYANPKFEEVSEYSSSECVGKPHKILRHPETDSEIFREMWTTIKKGEIFRAKYKNLSKYGKTYWVDAVIAPVLNSEGQPVKYIGIRYDITQLMSEQDRNKKLLTVSEKQAKQLQENEIELRKNIEDLVRYQKEMQKQASEKEAIKKQLQTRVDLLDKLALVSETDICGTITFANQRFCEVAKYSVEELVGKPHNIIRHPDTPKEVFREMWATIKAGKIFKGEIKNRAKDGSPYWVEVAVSPVFDERGTIVSYLAIRFDITEKILTREQNLIREEELKLKILALEMKLRECQNSKEGYHGA